MSELHDIGILGSGPAALVVARELRKRGASVLRVAPNPEETWRPNYCIWADELPKELTPVVEHTWHGADVETGEGSHRLDRPYVKLDTARFQDLLLREASGPNAGVVAARAVRLEHDADGSRIHTDAGSAHAVRVVVDASGSGSPFVTRVTDREPAFQTAYGVSLRAPSHGFDPTRMVLMDLRPAAPDATAPPSFLYVLPLSHDRVFLEETSLAHRPAVSPEVLRSRLQARLASRGLAGAELLGEERCSIAMGLGLPAPGQRVVPFGAAASMVHPVSGYLMANIVRTAPSVAQTLADNLGAPPDTLVANANAVLWPRALRSVWELYGFGLETLTDMDAAQMNRFFDSFFRLPLDAWSGFLSGTLPLGQLGSVMTRLFRNLPSQLRWHLVRRGMFAGAAPLARTVLQPGMT